MRCSSGRNQDPIPADATPEERAFLMKKQIKKLRKSPDVSKMWGFQLDDNNNTTYFFTTMEKRDRRLKEYLAVHSKAKIRKLISPRNKQLK